MEDDPVWLLSEEALLMPFSPELRVKIMELAINPSYSRGLLTEAMAHLRNGNKAAVAAILFDYISVTISFEKLARKFNMSSESLRRILGPSGRPTLEGLFLVIKELEAYDGRRERQAKTKG